MFGKMSFKFYFKIAPTTLLRFYTLHKGNYTIIPNAT